MKVTYTQELELSWKNVFNPENNYSIRGIFQVFQAARDAGYPYVAWNSCVYPSTSDGRVTDRIIETSELPT